MITIRRRSLVAVASVATVSLFPATKASSQLLAISKFPWAVVFWGLQVALAAIPYLASWLQGDSANAKAALCKLSTYDIYNLQFRCLAVALALDSNGDGPVIPPERGTFGIIPALADFVASQNHATEGAIRLACFRLLDVSERLISEVTKDNWFVALKSAGLSAEDVASLSEQLKYSTGSIGEFMISFRDVKSHSEFDATAARSLARQLSGMPLVASRAIESTQAIAFKFIHELTSCK